MFNQIVKFEVREALDEFNKAVKFCFQIFQKRRIGFERAFK